MTDGRVFLVAGEASGDGHAAGLVHSLRTLHPEWEFVGIGGPRMAEAGVALRIDLVDRSAMGLRRIVRELGFFVDLAAGFIEELDRDRPDLVVLVDYPGLNLNLARIARSRGIPVAYYICPQVWAWAPWRIRRIARRADLLLVILPFEEALYGALHPRVHYVGNPVFDQLQRLDRERPAPADPQRSLAIFPGSRRLEVEESLPVLLRVAAELVRHRDDLEVVISCHRPRLRPVIDRVVRDSAVAAEVVEGAAHTLQQRAFLSLVVSGTATLEQAYFGTPMVVVYPAKRWERWLFRTFRVTPFIALVNLFAGRRVVPEFLITPGDEKAITAAAVELLGGPRRDETERDLRELKQRLFKPGGSDRAAERISEFLTERSGAASE